MQRNRSTTSSNSGGIVPFGELTQPSQKAPENVVKDALKEKTEQALSPKQVNGETGVDYKVLQNVVHMMGLHLYVFSKHMKEKKYMAIN